MFDVAIWGTVSSWVGAGLTGGGVMIASLVYWRDSNLSKSAQAKKIHGRVVGDVIAGNVKVLIDNCSDARIFDVAVEVFPLTHVDLAQKELRLDRSLTLERALDKASDNQTASGIPETSTTFRNKDGIWVLEPTKLLEIDAMIQSPYGQRLAVLFTDLKGKSWRLRGIETNKTYLEKVTQFQYPRSEPVRLRERWLWLKLEIRWQYLLYKRRKEHMGRYGPSPRSMLLRRILWGQKR